MSIRSAEDGLFKRWQRRHQNLVTDGVVDEQAYLLSTPKLLFVLKEVNDENGGGWDLREYLRENGGRGQTWNGVSQWAKGIAALPSEAPWETLKSLDETKRIEALRPIAAMNLKKSPGGSRTNRRDLASVARADRDLLIEQFHLYSPDLVICCGDVVGDLMCEILQLDPAKAWRSTAKNVGYIEHANRKYLISYYHPQARHSKETMFHEVVGAVRELRYGNS